MGVWIETSLDNVHLSHEEVTPYVGVWIETPRRSDNHRPKTVTPYVGVWIETCQRQNRGVCGRSHPTWVCGLKPDIRKSGTKIGSHTLRGCVDWNTTEFIHISNLVVTPYVGVWIETSKSNCSKKRKPSHTLRGCVDWNINGPVFGNIEDGHTLRGNIWIGALFTRRSSLWKNCKHSASYVFLSRLLILLWLEKTRTSPNAYLLSVFFCCFT